MSSGGVAISMAHTHPPLTRTNTAPVFSANNVGRTGLPGLSQTMSHASRSSQLSGTTAYTSSSSTSLSSMTSSTTLVPNNGPVQATNNIINQRADASRSLYQICVNLRQRLTQVPGFDAHLNDLDDEDQGEDIDPVSSLWRCLRKGIPLLTIYNALQPAEILRIEDNVRPATRPKAAAFKFVEKCLRDLKVPPGECFTISDLFGDDTTGFVKVTQVINIVLDIARDKGLLIKADNEDAPVTSVPGSATMSYRDHVVTELVNTERKYVQDLENLFELKKQIEQKGVIPGDVVHDIFLNINAILDFQRRFLIKIETTNSQPDDRQEWGLPFTNYEEAFGIYQPFIANQRKAAAIAKREFDKIALADHPVVVDFNTLDGFLLKPMQRLVKYPLLLKDLRDKTNADEETKADLTAGIEAANRVLMQANAAVDRELRAEALDDLCARVDDWKNHRVDHFGDLLLHGHFPVVTGKSDVQKEVRLRSLSFSAAIRDMKAAVGSQRKSRDSFTSIKAESPRDLASPAPSHNFDQRHSVYDDPPTFMNDMLFFELLGCDPKSGEPTLAKNYADELGIDCPQYEQYTIYLFERILLCCKEVNPNKSKDKLMGGQKDKKDRKDKKNKEMNKNAKLQLKGRIFMTNVTEVISMSKAGNYTVQIFWKGDPGVENFIIRFQNDEGMKKWATGVDEQRKAHTNTAQLSTSPDAQATDFAWMRDQTAAMPNPYAQQEDEDDEDEYPTQQTPVYSPSQSHSGFPRNPSSTSLRSRSTTTESIASQSLAGIARGPPPRFPMNLQNPPLSVQTQIPTIPSPGQRGGDSYFSPVAESPASSRTSTTSSMFPFPRLGTPQASWEDSNRFTAPAMARAPSRDGSAPINAYQMNGRTPQRPSLPAMASHNSQTSISQQRSRSYSTPDINAQNGVRRPGPPSGPVPAVPGIPPHLHPAYDAGIPRSANSSPNGGLPVRTSTQSPGAQRDRLVQSDRMAALTQYPNAPSYNRSNTTQIPMTSADSRTLSPLSPPSSAMSTMSTDSDMSMPTQLKVKVNCDGNYVTLVVSFNISYQSLADRIDAKIGRFSTNAIGRGTMRLRYRDEDGDFVTIGSDDDIQIAFQEWREAQKPYFHNGQLGEIELFCAGVDFN